MIYHGIWPVASREFINVAAKVNIGEKCFIATKVCEYPYPEQKGVVRGICYIGGYILEKVDENKTKVTYISDVDLKGKIPGMVKKQVSKKQG